jgi:hypothetical protein
VNPRDLIQTVRALGVELALIERKLCARPSGALPEALRQALIDQADAIKEEFRARREAGLCDLCPAPANLRPAHGTRASALLCLRGAPVTIRSSSACLTSLWGRPSNTGSDVPTSHKALACATRIPLARSSCSP